MVTEDCIIKRVWAPEVDVSRLSCLRSGRVSRVLVFGIFQAGSFQDHQSFTPYVDKVVHDYGDTDWYTSMNTLSGQKICRPLTADGNSCMVIVSNRYSTQGLKEDLHVNFQAWLFSDCNMY